MTAHISTTERALIDAALAAGRATVIPPGVDTQPKYRWCPTEGKLVQIGGMNISIKTTFGSGGSYRKRAAMRPNVIAARQRRTVVAEHHTAGMTNRQISDLMGVEPWTVQADLKRLGLRANIAPPPPPMQKIKRRSHETDAAIIKAAMEANPTFGAHKLATLTGIARTTVSRHILELRGGATWRKAAYDAKRAEAFKAMDENPTWGRRRIAQAVGVHPATLQDWIRIRRAITGPRNQDRAVSTDLGRVA